MATKQNANVQSPAIEQSADVQKPEVQNVANVVTLTHTKPQANDSGKDAPATVADVRHVFRTDVEAFREAFAECARADSNATGKAAVCADLFKPLTTADQVGMATRHAIYGYIHGRAGKDEAEKWFGMKNQSEHPLYTVASNAVKRAKKRAERQGWLVPLSADTGMGRAARGKKTPGNGGDLLAALKSLMAADADFTTALSYAVESAANVEIFKAWAKQSQVTASRARIVRAA
ncbi:hypothetical protein PUN4_360003 [Paraburkholderia unamae]|uniref:hypothetical protein n=1 Tax=Paraburkholderia unamae TaxID=219649 RepID=UPI001CAB8DAE|nr:hypothetical protein [Paraburkholderia unamae]CAG9260915.1 hypothetical protein PUN4_360003 [Paraburkholderia unamae]